MVPHSGAWTFHCKSTGQFILKIHKKLVLDADYKYNGEEISRTLNLSKGIHPYRLYYKHSSPKPNISLQWESEKVAKSVILPVPYLLKNHSPNFESLMKQILSLIKYFLFLSIFVHSSLPIKLMSL